MVAVMDFRADGKKISQRVLEGVFRSQHRCVLRLAKIF